MYKKTLALVSVFFLVLFIFSGFVFANNDMKNGVSNAVNTVVDGVKDLGSDVRNGIGNAENGIEGALKMDDETITNENAKLDNDSYIATRTATSATTANNTATLWVWIIVAIAAIVIIGLVWYYGAQNNTHNTQ